MEPIRIVLLGTKHDHALPTFRTLMRRTDAFDLLAVVDDDIDAAKSKCPDGPLYMTTEEFFSQADSMKVEAVAVECEEERATAYANLCIERGWHLHVDKPGSAGYSSFCRMVDSAKAKGLVLQMGYMYRYNPVIQQTLARVRAGELGDIYAVEAHMSVRHDQEKRKWLGKYKGGMTYFLGCHLIDLILLFQGEPLDVIPYTNASGTEGVEAEDHGFTVLTYPYGVSFAKSCAAEYGGFGRRQLVICGTKGTVEIKPLEVHSIHSTVPGAAQYTRYRETVEGDGRGIWEDAAPIQRCEDYERYDSMMIPFARYIRGEEENPYTYDYEKMVFRTLMRACRVED